MADQFFKNRQGKRQARKEAIKQVEPFRYLIVCEGEKTEPNYFEGIKKIINNKFGNKIIVKDIKAERIVIDGTGRNTEDLVRYAIDKKISASIPYGHVWCVFDKDSFRNEQFNSAIQNCECNGIGAAWSNEAIELWFLLHFEYLNSAISRGSYIEKLNKYFKEYSINGGKYKKNIENIYELLNEYGDMTKAIKNAKKLKENFASESSFSDKNPSTNVYELIEELLDYLEN